MKIRGMEIAEDVARRAVVSLAETLAESAEGAAEHFTCREADELARCLALLGMQDEGEVLVMSHVHGDGQGDEGHGTIVEDDGETLTGDALTLVRVHVEALCAGTRKPGEPIVRNTEGGVRGTVVQADERGYGPFHGAEYHLCGKAFTEDGETFECTEDHGHEGPCSQ